MLHDEGASEAEVQAYLERWGLLSPELASHVVRFITDPTSRSYIVTYPVDGNSAARTWPAPMIVSVGC